MLITQKRFLTISGLTICSLALTSKSYAAERWESPTKQGHDHFDPMELSGRVDFWKGEELNRIVINGAEFGRGGGYVGSLNLDAHNGEYISALEVHGGNRIDLLYVWTNNGNEIAASGTQGHFLRRLDNIKLWKIGGTFEERLDKLDIKGVIRYRKASENAREAFLEHLDVLQAKESHIGADGEYSGAIRKLVTTEILPAKRIFKDKLSTIADTLFGTLATGTFSVGAVTIFQHLSWEI